MRTALTALFEEQQNNLRLFAGGAPVQLPQDGSLPSGPKLQQFGGVWGVIDLLCIILLREGTSCASLCLIPPRLLCCKLACLSVHA